MQAHAAPADDPVGVAAESFMRGLVQEEDVGLVFGYLREALAAAAAGREAPPPDRVMQRAEAIQQEAARRGVIAGRVLLDALEQSVRDMVRNIPRAYDTPREPPRPLQRIQY
jgi:hypothetical protein